MKNAYLLKIMKDSGLYHVDDLGRVWTTKKYGGQAVYKNYWRRAETAPAGSGRRQVRHNGVLVYVNRFVWYWFNGEIGDYEVDHKDNDKLNDHPDNLQRLTRLENQRKAEHDGLIIRRPSVNRSKAMKLWWETNGRKEIMSDAAKRGWEKRLSKPLTGNS